MGALIPSRKAETGAMNRTKTNIVPGAYRPPAGPSSNPEARSLPLAEGQSEGVTRGDYPPGSFATSSATPASPSAIAAGIGFLPVSTSTTSPAKRAAVVR